MKSENKIKNTAFNTPFSLRGLVPEGATEAYAREMHAGGTATRGASYSSDTVERMRVSIPTGLRMSASNFLSNGARSALSNLGHALLSGDSYRTQVMNAKSQMVLAGPAHQGFVDAICGFFASSTTDSEREACLNSLDQVALSNLLEELEAPSMSRHEQARANDIATGLLLSLLPGTTSTASTKRELKSFILRMHTDRTSPLNRDFGCAFRNNGRHLLWKFVLFLKSHCDARSCEQSLARETPSSPPPADIMLTSWYYF